MRRCYACGVEIEGAWTSCPLCGGPAAGAPVPDPFARIPLLFTRRRMYRVLFLTSIALVLVSFAVQPLFAREPDGIGPGRSVWLGVSAMWLVVLMAIRKRRNVAKSALYLVVLAGASCAYWDYLAGWDGWSLAYAVPILCGCSVLALLIAVPALSMEAGDHVLYSSVVLLLGIAPIAFVLLGWVRDPLPSILCAALCGLALLLREHARLSDAFHELAKRLHI